MNKFLFYLSIDLAILSQFTTMTALGESSSVLTLMKVVWILPLLYFFLTKPNSFLADKRINFFYGVILIFLAYCLTCQTFTGNQYVAYGTDAINIIISTVILSVSFLYWSSVKNKQRELQSFCVNLFVITLLFALDALINYRALDISVADRQYAFEFKNSMAFIMLIAVIGIFLNIKLRTPLSKLIVYAGLILILVVVIIQKSRATLVGLFVCIIYYIIKGQNKRLKWSLIVLSILSVVVILVSSRAYDLVVNNIIFANRYEIGTEFNLDDVSSGRFGIIGYRMSFFKGNEIIGVGNMYMDCFPLAILLQYGIVGFVIMSAFLITIYRKIIRKFNQSDPLQLAGFLLFLIAMTNSLFEAYPPFGPGVKCMLVWVFIGMAMANHDDDRFNVKYNQKTIRR